MYLEHNTVDLRHCKHVSQLPFGFESNYMVLMSNSICLGQLRSLLPCIGVWHFHVVGLVMEPGL